jgi:hypothetical protein
VVGLLSAERVVVVIGQGSDGLVGEKSISLISTKRNFSERSGSRVDERDLINKEVIGVDRHETRQKTIVQVHIPAGVADGQTLRF